jgi:hypothetical protein
MIYVYAITDRPQAALPSQLGLHDAGLDKVIWRDVVAVVSTFDGAKLSRSGDELWRHEAVVEALMCDRAVLPVRFGTLLPSRQDVGDMVCRAYRTLVEDIERVRGRVEIGVRFLTATAFAAEGGAAAGRRVESVTMPGNGPGAVYLMARLAKERELRNRQHAKLSLVWQAYERLARQANASRLDDEADDRHGTSAAFLVPRDRMASFRDTVSDVAKAHPELALLCTGPWPPYSFVSAGERATSWSENCHAG